MAKLKLHPFYNSDKKVKLWRENGCLVGKCIMTKADWFLFLLFQYKNVWRCLIGKRN